MLESQDVTSLPDFVEVPRLLEGSLFSLEFWKPPRKENARISVVIVPDRSIALCSLSYPSARRLDTALVAEFVFSTTRRSLFAKISLWCHPAPASCHRRGEQYITLQSKPKSSKYLHYLGRGDTACPIVCPSIYVCR
jgi:hypothetical protein